jgi:hypothetical protein
VKFKISDFPDHLQRQIQQKLDADTPAPVKPAVPVHQPETLPLTKEPNKTESTYRREVLDRNPAVHNVAYEGLTFRLANGHRYTPDWIFWIGNHLHCVEVKGSYRLRSYQRARLAFDQAAVEFPGATWIWAERTKSREWNVKTANQPKGAI